MNISFVYQYIALVEFQAAIYFIRTDGIFVTKEFKQTFFDYDYVDYEVRTNMPYPRVTRAIYLFLFLLYLTLIKIMIKLHARTI